MAGFVIEGLGLGKILIFFIREVKIPERHTGLGILKPASLLHIRKSLGHIPLDPGITPVQTPQFVAAQSIFKAAGLLKKSLRFQKIPAALAFAALFRAVSAVAALRFPGRSRSGPQTEHDNSQGQY